MLPLGSLCFEMASLRHSFELHRTRSSLDCTMNGELSLAQGTAPEMCMPTPPGLTTQVIQEAIPAASPLPPVTQHT